MAVFEYRKETLEAIARNELKKYDASLVNGEPRAIPIEEIAECHYGLDIEYRYLRKNNVILGCTVFTDALLPVWDNERGKYELVPEKRGTIVLDARLLESRDDGRLRFTLAHELGHYIKHREMYAELGVAAASATQTSLEVDHAAERQADLLAAAFLMPAGQVKRAFHARRSVRAGANPVAELAALFGVSKQAMGIFLREHNLA